MSLTLQQIPEKILSSYVTPPKTTITYNNHNNNNNHKQAHTDRYIPKKISHSELRFSVQLMSLTLQQIPEKILSSYVTPLKTTITYNNHSNNNNHKQAHTDRCIPKKISHSELRSTVQLMSLTLQQIPEKIQSSYATPRIISTK